MTLSYSELWFLELSVELGGRIPFDLLPETQKDQAKAFSSQWNKPAHGLTLQGIAEMLWSLLSNHEICFQHFTNADGDPPEFQPSSTGELVAILGEEYQIRQEWLSNVSLAHRENRQAPSPSWLDNRHSYSLTPKGISRWEEYAQPDWLLYRQSEESYLEDSDEVVWTAIAPTVDVAKEILAFEDPFEPVKIHWESLRCETLQPWEPFPGKLLPHGARVTVSVTKLARIKLQRNDFERAQQLHQEYSRRYDETYPTWYRRGVANHPDRPKPTK